MCLENGYLSDNTLCICGHLNLLLWCLERGEAVFRELAITLRICTAPEVIISGTLCWFVWMDAALMSDIQMHNNEAFS